MKCNFCHLTIKNAKYIPLSNIEILNNLKQAVEDQLEMNPYLKNYYVKLSWMGMGDALHNSDGVYDVSMKLLTWIFENGYAKGLDGVDLSSVFPDTKFTGWADIFNKLNTDLKKFEVNPNNELMVQNELNDESVYNSRSLFRMFYSIHNLDYEKRKEMIPNSLTPYEVVRLINEMNLNFNVIFHHMFIEGENDSVDDINTLKLFINNHISDKELRILRYNFCDYSPYRESENIRNIIQELYDCTDKLKVQISPGSEVSAARGQFLVSKMK